MQIPTDLAVRLGINTGVQATDFAFDPVTGKSIGSIAAMGEISGAPHIRLHARPTGAHLVALAFAVAASANLPTILYSLFWRNFTTRGALWSIYGGLIGHVDKRDPLELLGDGSPGGMVWDVL